MSRRAIVKRAKVKRCRKLSAEYVYRVIGAPEDELIDMLLGPGEWEPVAWVAGVERRRKPALTPKRWVAKKFTMKDIERFNRIAIDVTSSREIVWGKS